MIGAAAKSFVASDDGFDRWHQRRIVVLEAEAFHLVSVSVQLLGVDHGVPALAVKIAAEPSGNQLRVRHLVLDELIAGNLGKIDHDLGGGRRRHNSDGSKSEDNEALAMHECFSSSLFSLRTLTEVDALG